MNQWSCCAAWKCSSWTHCGNRPHPTHSTVERSLQSVEKLAPRRAFFTHICHDLPHERTEADLPPHVRLAYDGLRSPPGFRNDLRSLAETPGDLGPCAITIGNFDGVHKGHREIMRRVVGIAREHGWKSAVMTFDPHPTKLVAPARAPRLLTTPEQRARIIEELGIDEILILPFTAGIAKLTPEEFVPGDSCRQTQGRARCWWATTSDSEIAPPVTRTHWLN